MIQILNIIDITGRLAGLLSAISCSTLDCFCLSFNSSCVDPQRLSSCLSFTLKQVFCSLVKSSLNGSEMAADSVKLSKNLLRMKFMQRGLDAETKKQLEEDEKRIISDEHWYLDLPELKAKENLIIEEKSFVPCEELKYGRFSFKGFNPEVEKLMVLMNPRDEEEKEEEEDISRMQTDVTDEEMALRYESLVGSMKKKFAKKRERAAMEEDVNQNVVETDAKRVFLKPQD